MNLPDKCNIRLANKDQLLLSFELHLEVSSSKNDSNFHVIFVFVQLYCDFVM